MGLHREKKKAKMGFRDLSVEVLLAKQSVSLVLNRTLDVVIIKKALYFISFFHLNIPRNTSTLGQSRFLSPLLWLINRLKQKGIYLAQVILEGCRRAERIKKIPASHFKGGLFVNTYYLVSNICISRISLPTANSMVLHATDYWELMLTRNPECPHQ